MYNYLKSALGSSDAASKSTDPAPKAESGSSTSASQSNSALSQDLRATEDSWSFSGALQAASELVGLSPSEEDKAAQVSAIHAHTMAQVATSQAIAAAHSHVVQPGQTLGPICEAHGQPPSKWKELYEANRDRLDNPDKVESGMVLRLPSGWVGARGGSKEAVNGSAESRVDSDQEQTSQRGEAESSWMDPSSWSTPDLSDVAGLAVDGVQALNEWTGAPASSSPTPGKAAGETSAPEAAGDPGQREAIYLNQRDNVTNVPLANGKTIEGDNMCSVTSLAMQVCTMAGSIAHGRAAVIKVIEQLHGGKVDEPKRSQGQVEDLLYDRFAMWGAKDWLAACEAGQRSFSGAKWYVPFISKQSAFKLGKYHQYMRLQAFVMSEVSEFVDQMGDISMQTIISEDDAKKNRGKDNFEGELKPILEKGGTVRPGTRMFGDGHIVMLREVLPDGVLLNDPFGLCLGHSTYLKNGNKAGYVRKTAEKLDPGGTIRSTRWSKTPGAHAELESADPAKELVELGNDVFFTWAEVEELQIGNANLRVEAPEAAEAA